MDDVQFGLMVEALQKVDGCIHQPAEPGIFTDSVDPQGCAQRKDKNQASGHGGGQGERLEYGTGAPANRILAVGLEGWGGIHGHGSIFICTAVGR